MNTVSGDKLINNTFKWMIYGTPAFFTLLLALTRLPGDAEMLFIYGVLIIASATLYPIALVFLTIKDRRFLRSEGAFCPHWFWGFFQPIYVFKRLSYNGSSLQWFWLYLVLNFLLPGFINSMF